MNTEAMQSAVQAQSNILNAIGIKNQVSVSAGLVMLAVEKGNSAPIRKAFKKHTDGTITEVRGAEMVVFVWVSDEVLLSKKEIKQQALLLAA